MPRRRAIELPAHRYHGYLAQLSPGNIVTRSELATRVACDDLVLESGLYIAIVDAVSSHVAEMPRRRAIQRPAPRQHDQLAQLSACSVAVRAESTVCIAGDDAHTSQGTC